MSLVPRLRFNFYDANEKIDIIPTSLGSLVEFQRGYDLPKSQFKEGNIPVVSSNGILGYHNEYKIQGPGITIGRSGSVGIPHYINDNFFPHNTSLFVKDFKGHHPKYIFYLLKSLALHKRGSGSSVPTLNRNDLYPLQVKAYLNYNVQKEIASFLGVIDDKIDLLQKKENLLKKYKQGVLQKIFNQEIRFKQDDGSEFPAWNKNMTFGDCLSIPLREKPNQIDKNKLLTVKLNLNGIHQNKNVDTLSLGATYFVRRKGQFIYGKQNLFNGAFAIIPDEFDTYLSSTDIPALDFKENCIPKFLLLYLGRMSFYKSLEKYAVGTGSKRVHEALFLTIPICIPSILEQQEIANFLTAIDEKIDITTKQLEKTRQYKTALLQQLFI